MRCHQFTLDLSGNTGIPSQFKIGQREIVKWFTQQAKGHEKNVFFTNHYNRGCYRLQSSCDRTVEFLRDFKLEINWMGKTFLVPLKPELPNKPKFWVRMYGSCDGDMGDLPDTFFDELFEEARFVVVRPTEKRTHFGSIMYNGQRSALCMRSDETTDIQRQQEWIDESGRVYRWRIEYEGQPHQCTRGCGVFHEDGKCGAVERQRAERAMEGQQKCFFVSSSMLRLASNTKHTRVDAIPGAKVGHISNHINNDAALFAQADTVVVHAGGNMDLGSVAASKPHLEAQTAELTQVLAPLKEASKTIFVVDPVVGNAIKDAPGCDHWAMVRARMKKVAKKAKAEWISLNDVKWVAEEDVTQDGIHWSQSGTAKVMETIGKKVKEVTGVDVMEGMSIQERPYAGINRIHYRVGCFRCTRMHDGRKCPPLPDVANTSNNSSLNGSSFNSSSINDEGISFHSANNDSSSHESSHNSSNNSNTNHGNSEAEAAATADGTDKLIMMQIQSMAPTATPPSAAAAAAIAASPLLGAAVSDESPEPGKPSLKAFKGSASRSPSAQKRALDKSVNGSSESTEKKMRTRTDAKEGKGHVPRSGPQKVAKK